MKFWIYHTMVAIQRFFWGIRGFRCITAFGTQLRVSPGTVFPSYRRLKLPLGGYLSEIVRYGDFVQSHAICSKIAQMKEPPVIIEVGAHHGAYAIMMGKLVEKQGGKVLAIEPNPQSFNILKKNVSLNDLENTVTCIEAAVTETSGPVDITLEECHSTVAIGPEKSAGVTVQGIPLSNILEDYAVSSVSLLLVDVEGAELSVLKSFPWDAVPVQTIICEMHPYAWPQFGHGGKELSDFLSMKKYRCIDMYLQEYTRFDETRYIGPCLLLPDQNRETIWQR